MSDALLALWIALIAADRIDLAGGHAAFILTPFLALTPVVVLSELVRRSRRGGLVCVTRGALAYTATASALVTMVLLSVFAGRETLVSASRAMLLVGHITGTLVVAVLVADRPNLFRILARGALLSLCVFFVFDIGETYAMLGRVAETARFGPVLVKFGDLQTLGALPRPAGPVADANRAAFVLLFYIVVLAVGEPREGIRRLAIAVGAAFFMATFSRSGTLAALGLGLMTLIDVRPRIPAGLVLAGVAGISLAAAFLVARPDVISRIGPAWTSLAPGRLSVSEGSAQSHVTLIERGLTEASSSVARASIGLGYGNAYLELQDMFPGSKYGNYHSLYVTMFAEAGVFALLLTVVLFAGPLVNGGFWRPLVMGAAAFNLFYQTTTEPTFWLVLALAWIPVTGSSARGASPSSW